MTNLFKSRIYASLLFMGLIFSSSSVFAAAQPHISQQQLEEMAELMELGKMVKAEDAARFRSNAQFNQYKKFYNPDKPFSWNMEHGIKFGFVNAIESAVTKSVLIFGEKLLTGTVSCFSRIEMNFERNELISSLDVLNLNNLVYDYFQPYLVQSPADDGREVRAGRLKEDEASQDTKISAAWELEQTALVAILEESMNSIRYNALLFGKKRARMQVAFAFTNAYYSLVKTGEFNLLRDAFVAKIFDNILARYEFLLVKIKEARSADDLVAIRKELKQVLHLLSKELRSYAERRDWNGELKNGGKWLSVSGQAGADDLASQLNQLAGK